MGTGPFKFTNWTRARTSHSSRNESYWDTAHAPKTKSVVFSFIPEESTMTTGLVSGEIDGAYHTPYSGLAAAAVVGRRHAVSGKEHALHHHLHIDHDRAAGQHGRPAGAADGDRPTGAGKDGLQRRGDRAAVHQVPLAQWGYAQDQAATAWKKLPPPVLDLTGAKKLVAGAASTRAERS